MHAAAFSLAQLLHDSIEQPGLWRAHSGRFAAYFEVIRGAVSGLLPNSFLAALRDARRVVRFAAEFNRGGASGETA